jgi:hypothetical protein
MNRITFTVLFCVVLIAALPIAQAGTVDFSGLANSTAVTNQYPGVVFSLQGGPDSAGPPTIWNWESSGGALGNSTTYDYPTANILDIAFTSPVFALSFTFDNEGDNGLTYYTAYDSSHNVVSTLNIASVPPGFPGFSLITVPGTGIADLQINNGETPL